MRTKEEMEFIKSPDGKKYWLASIEGCGSLLGCCQDFTADCPIQENIKSW